MNESQPLLSLHQVSKSYGSGDQVLSIIDRLDFQVQLGEAVAITGPSGSGKSTLLYVIGLLERPDSGRIEIDGTDIWSLSERDQAAFRNQQIGFVFQDHHLLPQCTVLENVLIPTLPAGQDQSAAADRARELLDRVGLGARMNHLPSRISGGERQRVAVCRALINQPRLVLADEPTGNLDRRTATEVGEVLLNVVQESTASLVCVTHSQDLASRFPLHQGLNRGRLTPHNPEDGSS